MGTPSLVEQVRRYCAKDPANKIKLAQALGYKTPATLSVWIKKNNVPGFRREDVKAKLAELMP